MATRVPVAALHQHPPAPAEADAWPIRCHRRHRRRRNHSDYMRGRTPQLLDNYRTHRAS